MTTTTIDDDALNVTLSYRGKSGGGGGCGGGGVVLEAGLSLEVGGGGGEHPGNEGSVRA